MARIVVCYGDSITRGLISASYVAVLKRRMGQANLRFLNSGVNNDVTFNLLRRIHPLIEVQPDFITVLVGTNDVIASLSPYGALFYYALKRLPRWPTLEWSLASLRRVIAHLRRETRAVIGLCSIPPLGENLNTLPNQRVRAYNSALQEIANTNGLAYVPVFEHLVAHLPHSDGREFTASVNLLGELMLRRYVFKEPFERFSRSKGFSLLTDGVHLNESAAGLVAEEIEGFLRGRM